MKNVLEAISDKKPQPDPSFSTESKDIPDMMYGFLENFLSSEHNSVLSQEEFENLCLAIKTRSLLGLERYNTTLKSHNGRDFSRDFCEEIVDAMQYAQGLFAEGKISAWHVQTAVLLAQFINFLHEKQLVSEFYGKK